MKTTIKKITMAILIAIMTSVNLMAFEDSLKVNSGNSVDLVINDINKRTKITFKDDRDNILFEQLVDESGKFAKSFKLELLADGEYKIEIEDETRTKILPLNISKNIVYVNGSENGEYFKPMVSTKGSLVYVNQFSPKSSPLHISIYNKNNELVHEETLSGKMDLGKIFDFSKSLNGEYRIYMESKGITYDHLVYVEK